MILKTWKWLGVLACCVSLVLALSGPNHPPNIGAIPAQTVIEDQPTDAIRLASKDAETRESKLKLSGTSSNPTLVPAENIFFGTGEGHWYLTVTPAFGQTGSATITVTVSDGAQSASTDFLLTVNPPLPGAARFANPSPIKVPDVGAARPYPLTNIVTGMSGAITNMTVTLSKFSHDRVQDVRMLLVSPTGRGVVIFSHVSGGNRHATNVTVHLTDASTFPLPQDFQLWSEPLRPTAYPPAAAFPAPAPSGPYGAALSTFNGLPANGTWSLYVCDDRTPADGVIAGGWSLMIATDGGSLASTSDTIAPTESIPSIINNVDMPMDNPMMVKRKGKGSGMNNGLSRSTGRVVHFADMASETL